MAGAVGLCGGAGDGASVLAAGVVDSAGVGDDGCAGTAAALLSAVDDGTGDPVAVGVGSFAAPR